MVSRSGGEQGCKNLELLAITDSCKPSAEDEPDPALVSQLMVSVIGFLYQNFLFNQLRLYPEATKKSATSTVKLIEETERKIAEPAFLDTHRNYSKSLFSNVPYLKW